MPVTPLAWTTGLPSGPRPWGCFCGSPTLLWLHFPARPIMALSASWELWKKFSSPSPWKDSLADPDCHHKHVFRQPNQVQLVHGKQSSLPLLAVVPGIVSQLLQDCITLPPLVPVPSYFFP